MTGRAGRPETVHGPVHPRGQLVERAHSREREHNLGDLGVGDSVSNRPVQCAIGTLKPGPRIGLDLLDCLADDVSLLRAVTLTH